MGDLLGNSPAFSRLRNTARLVAATDVGLLLLGEPGSGRASVARLIHGQSRRAAGPLVVHTCAGSKAGALGALLDGPLLQPPTMATLYLDEVAELPAADQARLLNLLASADGDPRRAPRLIAASVEDLATPVARGALRRDLSLRLGVVPIGVPPLRERVLDIPALANHFLATAAARHQTTPPRLSAGAERLFRRYPWPGNVRELANLCERLAILYPDAQVRPEVLPRELVTGAAGESSPAFTLPPHGIDLNVLEAEMIRQALALAGGNKSRAARLLGLTRDTLLYRLQKHLIPG